MSDEKSSEPSTSSSPSSSIEISDEYSLHYEVNDIPPLSSILLFGFQQMMLCMSGLLVLPFLISQIACAGSDTITLRVQLIAATFVTSGIATLLQTTFGLRLCILHGPSFAYLPPLLAYAALPENKCTADLDTIVPKEEWLHRILTIQGSLFCGVLIMILCGMSGLVGAFAKCVGPITITPLLILLTMGTIPTLEEKMALHWISIVEYVILICFGVFLENVHVPIPYFSFSKKKICFARVRLFGQFPYLIGIGLAWLICYILTLTNLEPVNGQARTDKNATVSVLIESPWFQIPYPGQFGFPRFSTGLFLGFLASSLACMMESIGDYEMCAKVSHQRSPQASSVNRAMVFEGIGGVLASLMGLGCAVTTYAENIALMHITKVVSRVTMQMAGVMCIVIGLFTKVAALLASIPDAVVGGVLAMGMSMITGVALSNLQTADLRISRNLTIMGAAILVGCVVPTHFEKHPIETGHEVLNDVLNMLLAIRMLIGGLVAFTLDNTVPGATKSQRGLQTREDKENLIITKNDGYALPMIIDRFLIRFPVFSYLPFIPSQKSLLITISNNESE